MKDLLQKFILNECTPTEMEEVILFFQKSKDADVEMLPEGEEVLNALREKLELSKSSSQRIYNTIMHSRERKQKRSFLRRHRTQLAAAAIFIGILCSGLFLRKGFQNDPGRNMAPAEQYITLQLNNGQTRLMGDTDSLELTDDKGNVLGIQQGSSLSYAPGTETTSLRYNTISVPYGKRFELSLSDGTRVFLNAGTSLKFPISFVKGKKREVFLTGEAFFDVTEDKSNPFIVNTEALSVEVLGTEFNVEAYKNAQVQNVVLLEGKVKVDNGEGGQMIMSPDQMVSSSEGSLTRTSVAASDYISWKNGYFTLQSTSAAETIGWLERYYHIEITSKDQEDLEKIAGSGKIYLSEKVENVIKTLSILTSNEFTFEYK